MARIARCDRGFARERLKKAESFLATAEMVAGGMDFEAMTGEDRSTAVTNAVHACIAAADAITCTRLGERSNDRDHAAAVRLLSRVDDVPARTLQRFKAAIGVKSKAGYDAQNATVEETKSAVRAAKDLVRLAKTVV